MREEKHIEQSTQGVMGILSLKEGWNSSLAVVAEMERGGSESQKYLPGKEWLLCGEEI